MEIVSGQQGSAEWYRARLGKPTSSMFHRIITAKGEPSRQAIAYLYRLLAERLLRESMDDQLGHVEWAERGRAQEPDAMRHYAFTHDVELLPVGFILSDDHRYGCSPDRLIAGRNESVECKCPAPWTHLRYLLEGPGADYKPQVQGQLLVTGFEAVNFYSWHPRMPPYEIVILPDREFQEALASALGWFCDALDSAEERARELGAYVVASELMLPLEQAYQLEPEIIVPD